MSNFDKHVLAFFPPIYASGQLKDYRVLEISDTLFNENDESLVFVTIWDYRTHVRRTSSVEQTDLDFKISVALIRTSAVLSKFWGTTDMYAPSPKF